MHKLDSYHVRRKKPCPICGSPETKEYYKRHMRRMHVRKGEALEYHDAKTGKTYFRAIEKEGAD